MHRLEEVDRFRIAPVLAADAAFQFPFYRPAAVHRLFDQLADTCDVHALERVFLQQVFLQVFGHETADIIPAVAQGHLGQIIGAETEEVGVHGNVVSGNGGPGNLDHGAYGNIQFAGELFPVYHFADNLLHFFPEHG